MPYGSSVNGLAEHLELARVLVGEAGQNHVVGRDRDTAPLRSGSRQLE